MSPKVIVPRSTYFNVNLSSVVILMQKSPPSSPRVKSQSVPTCSSFGPLARSDIKSKPPVDGSSLAFSVFSSLLPLIKASIKPPTFSLANSPRSRMSFGKSMLAYKAKAYQYSSTNLLPVKSVIFSFKLRNPKYISSWKRPKVNGSCLPL